MTSYANNPIEASLTNGDREVEALWELENSRLVASLLETLRVAQSALDARLRYEAANRMSRASSRPQSAVEGLAEALLDWCGSPDDPSKIREHAESALERQREYDRAREW